MNANVEMQYLSGGDDIFGPDYGGATVHTNVRAGYTDECPNVGRFLENLVFSRRNGKRDHGRHPRREPGSRGGGDRGG